MGGEKGRWARMCGCVQTAQTLGMAGSGVKPFSECGRKGLDGMVGKSNPVGMSENGCTTCVHDVGGSSRKRAQMRRRVRTGYIVGMSVRSPVRTVWAQGKLF